MAAEGVGRILAQRRPGAGDLDVLRQLYIRLGRGGVQSVHPLGKPAQFLRRADKVGGLLRAGTGGLGGLVGQGDRNGLLGIVFAHGKGGLRHIVIGGVFAEGDGIAVIARLGEGVGVVAAHVRGQRILAVLHGQGAVLHAGEGQGAGEGGLHRLGDAVFIYGCPLGNGVAAEVLADFKVGQLGNQGIGGEFINGTSIAVFGAFIRGKNLERLVAVFCGIVRKVG